MTNLTLKDVLKYGKYKGLTIREFADFHWFGFKSWYEKYPYLFAEDVEDYYKQIKSKIFNLSNTLHGKRN